MKRLLTLFIVMLMTLSTHAVLKEKDLDQTLQILRTELASYDRELQERMEKAKQHSEQLRQQLIATLKQSNQNSLMLYSQQQEYVFDLTYACHEATEQYRNFKRHKLPFSTFLEKTESEIARYDSLIASLNAMPTKMLSPQTLKNRNMCMVLANNIRTTLEERRQRMEDHIAIYNMTEQRLSNLNEYAQKRYNEIQTSIFKNGGNSYFTILQNFGRYWRTMTETVERKYQPNDRSQWNSRWIFGLLLSTIIYAIIASLLNFLVIRYVVPKRLRTDEFMKKRACITMATTTITFALILGITLALTDQNFFIMAANLLVEYAWLLGVILISLLLRVDGDQIRSAFRVYSPLIVIGFIVIVFRIVLVPNELVNMILPPILLCCGLWQWSVIRRHNKNIPRSDMFYSYISLVVFTASVVCSWSGYTLLAVQLLIWWIMQLTCVLTITCVSQYIHNYAQRHGLADKPATKTWGYRLVEQVVMPVLSVLSLMVSVYWAAKVFNLNELCWRIFNYQFINMENLQVSILKLSIVICLWFLFRWIANTILSLLRLHYVHRDPTTAASREVMGRNVIQVFVWGVWLMISLSILNISVTWLVAISGGLSTGIGFASKDIIENIYYGASLMAGRIKVGDWIQVNDTMGKVRTISYTSTVVDSLYGEVITFQNSQLFKSNYKNLTRNYGYVLAVVPFGVAYGSNLKEVTELVEKAVNGMRHMWMDRSKKVKCVVSEMADSSVNFKLFVWADAPKKSYVVSDVLKCVYDTLYANGISIPFPQRDVHIVK